VSEPDNQRIDGPEPAPDLRAATAAGVRWVSMARITSELVMLASMVALARLIPPAAFGAFAVALIVQELALSIPGEGVGSALVQRKIVERAHLQVGVLIGVAAGFVFAALTVVASYTIVGPLFDQEAAQLVRLSAPLFVLASLSTVPVALLRRRLDFARISILDTLSVILRSVVSVALAAFAGMDGEALVIAGLVSAVVGTVVAFVLAPTPFPRWNRQAAREVLSYGLPAAAAAVAWTGFRNGDYAVLNARLGPTAAGFYWRAFQLAVEYQRKISIVMYQVAFPVLSRADDPAHMLAIRTRMTRLLAVILFPLLAMLAATAPIVVPWLFGEAWSGAIVPTQILAASGAATLVIDALGSALMAAGRPRALLVYGVAHFAVYVTIVFFVAPLGIVAVAIAAVCVHTLFLFIAYGVLLRGFVPRPLFALVQDVGPATVCSVVLLGVAAASRWALDGHGIPTVVLLAILTVVGAFTYLLTLRALFPAAWTDLFDLLDRVGVKRRLPLRLRRLGLSGSSA
jgi:O-antigen/teichoic acid export membrane protein